MPGGRDPLDAQSARRKAPESRAIFEFKMLHRAELAALGKAYYREVDGLADFPLVGKQEWLPQRMVPLEEIDLAKPEVIKDMAAVGSAPLKFLKGQSCEAWSKTHNPAMMITDEVCYRLLGIGADAALNGAARLTFGLCSYQDYYNTCEARAFELSAWRLANPARAAPDPAELRARGRPDDVWALADRNAVPGQNALFLVHGLQDSPPQFLFHDRKKKKTDGKTAHLAEGQNTLHVVPAGTFQPDNAGGALKRDFSLTRAILRELAEELLGQSQVEEQCRMGEDFLKEPKVAPYVSALKSGALRIFYLGLGFDPATTKPEILLVMILNARAVGIRSMSDFLRNWEGTPNVADWEVGWLDHFGSQPTMLPAGAACMARAALFFDDIEAVIRDQV